MIASHFYRPSGIGTGDIIGIILDLVIIGSQERITPKETAVIETQAFLNLGIMLQESLLFLFTHFAFTQFCHEKRVAPLKHMPLISRLPQLEPQTIRHLEPFLQLLARFLILGDTRGKYYHQKYDHQNDAFNIIPDSVFIFLCLSKFLVMRNLSFYFTF